MKLGIVLAMEDKIRERILDIKAMGFDNIQLSFWTPAYYTDQWLQVLKDVLEETGIVLTHFWAGFDPPVAWNFYDGPISVGLVPEAYRDRRITQVLEGAKFAKALDVQYVATHLGFLPEDPNDPLYTGTIVAVDLIAKRLAKDGQVLLFETGQETPTTLLRMFEDLRRRGSENVGVNFDPANFLHYGKANPVDAVSILAPYIRGVHAKDALYPTDGFSLGKEVDIGKGLVNFPMFIAKLKEIGYQGYVTIERELECDPPMMENPVARIIQDARDFLLPLLC
ncbi:MAG: sugar phosphate isomerase/epimerase [Clostridiales bacterium]|nr:sugar phosphate isomerase/epimerase [Clostridiales bacterium]